MNRKQTHEELVDHLQAQFEINRKALHDLRELTRQLQAMNGKLQESEALKSHFLSNIRNEITNPLTSIMGLSNRLLAGEEPARLPAVARMIHDEAFALDFQLQNIFAAAELEAGEASPDWAQVDVTRLVAPILEMLEHRLTGKRLRLETQLPTALPLVSDPRRLHLMVINLLANAVEYSPEGETIALQVGVEEGDLTIRVRDRGTGIPPADREAIFDRFRQLESGSAKGHRGHGLGLSVSRSLAELLGGTLELEEVAGPGASILLRLPPAAQAADTFAPQANLFIFGSGERF